MRYPDQVLVFDADDTLWENNHLFERVIDDYLGWLAHPSMTHEQIRTVLLDIEAANSGVRCLRRCVRHDESVSDDTHAACPADPQALTIPLGAVRQFP